QGDEFRSNVHRGGRAEPVDLDPEYERAAVRAAQVMGLRVAGVDMLESNEGCKVMEVNSSPGLEGIEGATGVDVAGRIIDYVEKEILFPEVDVRQRLALSAGHAVMDVPVEAGSPLADRSLQELALRERDIVVLTITRDNEVISVPRGSHVLRVGDNILCYGNTEELKQLVPPRKRRKSKSAVPPPATPRDRT
ncbi:MAG: hypothetical protein KC417_02055, partial [Myxococcales bacterium]|nr:hypothetical protein [Myxococcales bacterium]